MKINVLVIVMIALASLVISLVFIGSKEIPRWQSIRAWEAKIEIVRLQKEYYAHQDFLDSLEYERDLRALNKGELKKFKKQLRERRK